MNPVLGAWKLSQRAVAVAVVVEGVHDVRRHGDEGSGRRTHGVTVGADPELQLALDDVEGVDVLVVHVQLRAAFACVVTRPGGVEQRVLAERAHRALGRSETASASSDREDARPAARSAVSRR